MTCYNQVLKKFLFVIMEQAAPLVKQISTQRRAYADDGIFVLNVDEWNDAEELDDEDEHEIDRTMKVLSHDLRRAN